MPYGCFWCLQVHDYGILCEWVARDVGECSWEKISCLASSWVSMSQLLYQFNPLWLFILGVTIITLRYIRECWLFWFKVWHVLLIWALHANLAYRPFPGVKWRGVHTDCHYQGPRSSRLCNGFTQIYAERYVKRFTVTPCSEKLATMHNALPCIQEDLGPSLLHASLAELPTHNNRETGDYSSTRVKKKLEMGTVLLQTL